MNLDFMPGTGAADLLLSFFDWGYRTPEPARAGTKRRIARWDARRQSVADLYAKSPSFPPTRQVRRKAARAKAKAMRDKKHGWRDFLDVLATA